MKTTHMKQGGALPIVFLLVIILSVMSVGIMRLAGNNGVGAVYVEQSEEAFWIAETGVQQLVSKIRNDDGYRSTVSTDSNNPDNETDTIGNGSYSVDLWKDFSGSNFVVRSTGTVRGESRLIDVRFALARFGPYGITTIDGNSQIRRNGSITGSVYVNGDLTTRSGTVITGSVLAENHDEFGTGEPIPEDGELDISIDQSYFTPYFGLGVTGTPVTDPLDLSNSTVVVSSSIDPSSIISSGGEGTLVVLGDQTFSKDLIIGDDVTVIVQGDLTIRKTASMGSGVTLFTTGEADLFKDAAIGSESTSLDGCSILCLGDMKVWKNFDFNGTLFTEGYLQAEKDLDVQGTVITHDGFDIKQNANIVYDPAMIDPDIKANMFHGTYIVLNSQWTEIPVN